MAQEQETQHALLIAWGRFAQEIGLNSGIEAVKLGQKIYTHTSQAKVLELLVAILSGLKQLQDISLAAHLLAKDLAVAKAWGQPRWADYTSISRTLKSLSWGETEALVAALERVSQPFLERELASLRTQGRSLQYDGDLTGLPVSNTSRTYPNAAYGHMSDEIRLGYQAGLVSLQSPTNGRLWLSVAHYAGDTVSCSQVEALVLAAEKRSGQRPQRRTELLQQRLEPFVKNGEPIEKRLTSQQTGLEAAIQAQTRTMAELQTTQASPKTKPQRLQRLACRYARRVKAAEAARKKLGKTQARLEAHREQEKPCAGGWNSSSMTMRLIPSPSPPVFAWMLASAPTITSPYSSKWAMRGMSNYITTKSSKCSKPK